MQASASGHLQPSKSLKVDAIRFMAALWVMFFHFGPPPFKTILTGHLAPIGAALWSGSVVLFAGPAAVIVFFVISGYCIHNAYHRDATLSPINYFASRYVRIGLPLAVIAVLAQFVGSASNLLQSVLWSLYCEMVYYTVYPLVRQYFSRIGEMIFGVALIGAAMVWFVHTRGQLVCAHCVYENYGVAGTSLLYLPGWLLGCLIAETQRPMHDANERRRWSAVSAWLMHLLRATTRTLSSHVVLLRVAVVAAASLTFVLAASSHIKPAFLPFIGPDIALPVFQLVAAAWIAVETTTPARSPFWARVGALGAWSYSLYLCHKLAIAVLGELGTPQRPLWAWCATVALALAMSYTFYLAVERPSHRFARRLRRFATKAPTRTAL